MPISKRLKKYLDDNQIRYVTVKHSEFYTAQEIASSLHVPGDLLAKTVLVNVDGNMIMVVLPASYQISFDLLKESLKASEVSLASEMEFTELFPDCEPGAMPPFGNLYNMHVYADKRLAENNEIIFNAGNHHEAIRMNYKDYEKLVQPSVLKVSEHLH